MNSIMDKLWTMHEAEAYFSCKNANKFKEVVQARDQLFDMLGEEEKALFEELEEMFQRTNKDVEKNAFQDGVRFATRYLIEALYGGDA